MVHRKELSPSPGTPRTRGKGPSTTETPGVTSRPTAPTIFGLNLVPTPPPLYPPYKTGLREEKGGLPYIV